MWLASSPLRIVAVGRPGVRRGLPTSAGGDSALSGPARERPGATPDESRRTRDLGLRPEGAAHRFSPVRSAGPRVRPPEPTSVQTPGGGSERASLRADARSATFDLSVASDLGATSPVDEHKERPIYSPRCVGALGSGARLGRSWRAFVRIWVGRALLGRPCAPRRKYDRS